MQKKCNISKFFTVIQNLPHIKPENDLMFEGLWSELLVEAKLNISVVNLFHLASTFDLKSVSSTNS